MLHVAGAVNNGCTRVMNGAFDTAASVQQLPEVVQVCVGPSF